MSIKCWTPSLKRNGLSQSKICLRSGYLALFKKNDLPTGLQMHRIGMFRGTGTGELLFLSGLAMITARYVIPSHNLTLRWFASVLLPSWKNFLE